MEHEALQVISLSRKAGKALTGEEKILDAVRSGQAKLVIVSEEASSGTKKRYSDKCLFYGVDRIEAFGRSSLGLAVGKETCAAVAVTDEGLKQLFLKKWNKGE